MKGALSVHYPYECQIREEEQISRILAIGNEQREIDRFYTNE